MKNDPRAAIGSFLTRAIVAGYKAVKYLLIPKYRSRVREYWRSHPQFRAANIRLMVFGVVLDLGLAWLIVEALTHP